MPWAGCCALSMNDQPETDAHKADRSGAPASHRWIITFSARRQHRKSVSAQHFKQREGSLQVTAAAPTAQRNYRPAFGHRPCIQTNEMRGPAHTAKMPRWLSVRPIQS